MRNTHIRYKAALIKQMDGNNLELYLKDLFDKECKFKTEEGEEDFIREGVETIVGDLVEKTLPDYYDMIKNDEQDIFKRIRQDKEYFKREEINCIECSTNDILKVGSYNEGTRNNFPDEFDFIFPVFCLEPTRELKTETFNELFRKIQKDILPPTQFVSGQRAKRFITNDQLAVYTSQTYRSGKIRLERTPGIKGPARELKFKYHKAMGDDKDISVDLVSAVIIKGDFSNLCQFEPLRHLAKSIGQILIVRDAFTFTEAEVKFMTQEMSLHHRTVYRLLKFLLNGNTEGEYSSYMIKMYMVRHHSENKCQESSNLGSCILNVLDDMSLCLKNDDLPEPNESTALHVNVERYKFLALKQMVTLVDSLKTVRNSKDVYNFQEINEQIPKQFVVKNPGLIEGVSIQMCFPKNVS